MTFKTVLALDYTTFHREFGACTLQILLTMLIVCLRERLAGSTSSTRIRCL